MTKINTLISQWKRGTIALSSYLNENSYPTDLLNIYMKGGWLESLGYGAYKLANDPVDWPGAIYALQAQKKSYIHPGGKTALELRGFAHYPSQGRGTIYLFGNSSDLLPKWARVQPWSASINQVRTSLFDYQSLKAFSDFELDGIPLKISSPELAILEMLHLVPKYNSFDEAFLIMEGLTALRSGVLQELLQKCSSIKVKRLFLYMAEKNSHPWFKKIDPSELDLGSGKRVIIEDGKLNKKYNITVPREYEEQQVL